MPSLPDLPTELLTDIVKYYPELLPSIDACVRRMQSNQFEGDDTLRALSQTCRTFRNIFLPVLWARVHATFNLRTRSNGRIRTRAKMLERRMKGILKTPSVVPYIQSLSITFGECNMSNWQPMAHFVRVLQFHNLPNFHGNDITGQLFITAKDHCKYIHIINNLPLWTEVIRSLHDGIPKVQHLSIWEGIDLDMLRLLEGMDNLSDLRIRIGHLRRHRYPVAPLEEIIPAAERILRTSKAPRQKELRIQHLEGAASDSDDIIREESVLL